jgi:hypothetical protein
LFEQLVAILPILLLNMPGENAAGTRRKLASSMILPSLVRGDTFYRSNFLIGQSSAGTHRSVAAVRFDLSMGIINYLPWRERHSDLDQIVCCFILKARSV